MLGHRIIQISEIFCCHLLAPRFFQLFSAPRFVFFSDIVFFILCQQFSMGCFQAIQEYVFVFVQGILSPSWSCAGCTVVRKHLRAMNVVKVEHVVFQDLQIEIGIHFFVLWEKVQTFPSFLS